VCLNLGVFLYASLSWIDVETLEIVMKQKLVTIILYTCGKVPLLSVLNFISSLFRPLLFSKVISVHTSSPKLVAHFGTLVDIALIFPFSTASAEYDPNVSPLASFP